MERSPRAALVQQRTGVTVPQASPYQVAGTGSSNFIPGQSATNVNQFLNPYQVAGSGNNAFTPAMGSSRAGPTSAHRIGVQLFPAAVQQSAVEAFRSPAMTAVPFQAVHAPSFAGFQPTQVQVLPPMPFVASQASPFVATPAPASGCCNSGPFAIIGIILSLFLAVIGASLFTSHAAVAPFLLGGGALLAVITGIYAAVSGGRT